MKGFLAYIKESLHSFIHDDPGKEKHKHELHAMLQKAYASIGGIHGNGFQSADHMVKHIDEWKIHKHKGKIVAAILYKNKNGRKGVAVATDGTEHGKTALGKMMHHDVAHGRAWSEKSGSALSFTKKQFGGNILPHAIPFLHAQKLHDDEIRPAPHSDPEILRHPELKHHFYQRKIGGEWHTKIALGKPHQPISS